MFVNKLNQNNLEKIFNKLKLFVFMFLLEIKLGFDSKEQAKRFFNSIKPELEEEFLRSKTTIAQKEEQLEIKVSAQDKTALRASLNALSKPLVLFSQLEELE